MEDRGKLLAAGGREGGSSAGVRPRGEVEARQSDLIGFFATSMFGPRGRGRQAKKCESRWASIKVGYIRGCGCVAESRSHLGCERMWNCWDRRRPVYAGGDSAVRVRRRRARPPHDPTHRRGLEEQHSDDQSVRDSRPAKSVFAWSARSVRHEVLGPRVPRRAARRSFLVTECSLETNPSRTCFRKRIDDETPDPDP